LATGKLVPARTLVEALTPGRVAEGTSTYGFGWNVAEKDGDTYVWHTGNADGRRAFLGRRVKDGITVIILTQGNSRRLEIADAVVDILHGRSYTPPRLSISRPLLAVIDAQGIDAAMARYRQLRSTEATTYDFSEPELNSLGYFLLDRNDAMGAIRVFELNAQQFPASSNAFDSLGEALTRSGRLTEAAQAYARALELDPHNVNAQRMLQKLK
jgi:D-alanyl-D-alanine-carboxypeptidase/D-alanyl-D-alanine-endopeptidase